MISLFNDSLNYFKALGAIGNKNTSLGTSADPIHDFSVNISRELSEEELELLYIQSRLIQKIVDYYPLEATAKEVVFKSSDEKVDLQMLQMEMQRLSILDTFCKAAIEARIYRDSYLVIGVDDGRDLSKPINLNNVRAINWIKPALLKPDSSDFYTPTETYHRVDNMEKIHSDRVLAFAGKELPLRMLRRFRSSQNLSVIESLFIELAIYLNATKASSAALSRSGVFIYKMKGLAKAVATISDLFSRFEMLNTSLSVLKGLVIDSDSESVEYVSQNLSSYKELLDKFEDQLIAVSGYPRSKLLGSSNSNAFSEGGESDRLEWAQLVANYQQRELLPQLKKLMSLICLSKQIDYNLLSIEFNSILIPKPSELKQQAKLQAEIDKLYLEMGVLTSDEIREARFGAKSNTTIVQEN